MDIWACGVIMFIILNGDPPFDGANDLQISQKVKDHDSHELCNRLTKVSDQGKELILLMLDKNP